MSEATVLHQRRRRMAHGGLGNISSISGGETDNICYLSGADTAIHTARIEVGKMSDPEKIAKATGMMEVSKAVCMNTAFQNDAQRVATILQITTDAMLSVLKDDD